MLSAKQTLWLGVLLISFCFMRLISTEFAYEAAWHQKPVYTFVVLLVVAGLTYLALTHEILKSGERRTLWLFVTLGLLLRVIWLGSDPILEDDSYRYFWDGALVAAGFNPYEVAPIQAFPNPLFNGEQLEPALQTIVASGQVERVAYPSIATIYPPVTQLVFAYHSMIAAWDLDAWRLVLLIFDCATLFFLMELLSTLKKDRAFALVFWLNPLIIVNTANAGHMDALLLPFLVAAALAMVHYRFQLAALCLAGAVGVKIWPIMLAPIFMAFWLKQASFLWRQVAGFALTLGLLSSALLLPQLLSNATDSAGLIAYSSEWQNNALLFMWLKSLVVSLSNLEAGELTRVAVVVLMLLALAVISLNAKPDPTKNLLVATAVLFFLSPTGYPWYYAWLLIWLATNPSLALLSLTATLPLYYLRFTPFFDQHPEWFNLIVVPMQFLPPLLLLSKQKLSIHFQWQRPTYA